MIVNAHGARAGIFNYLTGRAICQTPRPVDEAEALLDAYRAEVLAEAAAAARTAAPELPVWLGTPVVCPHCTCEQTHCNSCGFDMYDPPIGGGA